MSSMLPLRRGINSLSAGELPCFRRPSSDSASVAFSDCDALRFRLLRLLGRRTGAFCGFSFSGGGELAKALLLRRLRKGQIAMDKVVATSRSVHALASGGVWCGACRLDKQRSLLQQMFHDACCQRLRSFGDAGRVPGGANGALATVRRRMGN